MGMVSLRGIRKSYGKIDVIKGIDLEVANGEFLVVVGPSGCVKSTTLRMIAGLESVSGGDLLIDGARANDLRPEHLRLGAAGQGIPASVVLAEHLGDSSIIHLRVDGIDDLLIAKVGIEFSQCAAGQNFDLAMDPAWALMFDGNSHLLS